MSAKFNLRNHYPPSHNPEVWHSKHANVYHIKKAINMFAYENIFVNIDVVDKIEVFDDETPLYDLSKFILQETVTIGGKDSPSFNTK